MAKVITFGELMLRLSGEGNTRLLQKRRFDASFGGAEANVAVCLANLGEDVAFATKLPENQIADEAVRELRSFGVDTSYIARGGDRMGIYYVEKGAGERGSICLYDRAHSSIAEATRDDFDWEAIFDGAEWFHFSGITPALSDAAADLCMRACIAARVHGLTVSCDINYRSQLWPKYKADYVMDALCLWVDVCIANESDVADVFGIKAGNTDVTGGKLDLAGYESVAKQLVKRFDFDTVAFTLRTSYSASDNGWQGMLYDRGQLACSREHAVRIVDRVGSGDSFAAGLIWAKRHGMDVQDAVEFAAATGALAHTIEGDYNRISLAEVERLAAGDASGRVRR